MQETDFDEMDTSGMDGKASGKTPPEPGFKKTKVGWVPEEWEVTRMRNLIRNLDAGTSVKGEDRPRQDGEKGILKVSAVSYDGFLPSECKVIPDENLDRVDTSPKEGHVIISRANTRDLVGSSVFVERDYPELFLPDKLWQVELREDKAVSARWLNYALSTDRMRHLISSAATGSSGTMKNISQKRFLSLPIAVPPLDEQLRTAGILSTWDRAINQIDNLIAKKERRKKALMQHLIKGKTRFSNHKDKEWCQVTLSDIADYYSGLSGKSGDDFGSGNPYVPYKNIFENNIVDLGNLDYVEIEEGESQNRVQHGNLLVTTSSEVPEEVGMTSVVMGNPEELYLNSFCFGVRFDSFEKVIPEFAAYLFRAEPARRAIYPLAQGSTRFNLSRREFMTLTMEVPSIQEQKKIASVLSTCDEEISILRDERQAHKRQKKGIMQKLLKGKVRVSTEATSSQVEA